MRNKRLDLNGYKMSRAYLIVISCNKVDYFWVTAARSDILGWNSRTSECRYTYRYEDPWYMYMLCSALHGLCSWWCEKMMMSTDHSTQFILYVIDLPEACNRISSFSFLYTISIDYLCLPTYLIKLLWTQRDLVCQIRKWLNRITSVICLLCLLVIAKQIWCCFQYDFWIWIKPALVPGKRCAVRRIRLHRFSFSSAQFG